MSKRSTHQNEMPTTVTFFLICLDPVKRPFPIKIKHIFSPKKFSNCGSENLKTSQF